MTRHRNHFQDPSASVGARTNHSIILILSMCRSMGTHQLSIRKVANIIFSVVFSASPEATAHIGATSAAAACAAPPVVQRMNQLVGMGGKACIWQPCWHKMRAIFRIRQFNAASWRLRGLWKTLMLLTDNYGILLCLAAFPFSWALQPAGVTQISRSVSPFLPPLYSAIIPSPFSL